MRFVTAIALLLAAAEGLAMPAPDSSKMVLDTRAGGCKCSCMADCRSRCLVGGTPGSAVGAAFCISGCNRFECGCDGGTHCNE